MRIVKDYHPPRTKGGNRVYNWTEIFATVVHYTSAKNKTALKLYHGKDFSCEVSAMINMLKREARKRFIRISYRKHPKEGAEQREAIAVMFVGTRPGYSQVAPPMEHNPFIKKVAG